MIDVNKPIRTKTGREARILATDLKGKYPIAVVHRSFCETTDVVTINNMEMLQELFENIPERKSRWLNIYDFNKFLVQTIYTTKDAAKSGTVDRSRQGVLEFVYEGDKFIEAIFHSDVS